MNRENLEKALNGKGEILIIQSDDFIDDKKIICESDNCDSFILPFKDINRMIKTKNINYKIIILCFPNSSSLKINFDANKIIYKYLISFNRLNIIDDDVMKMYNKACIEFLIDFIKHSVNNLK